MGLIKAAVGAVGSTLHDQWKDYIRCEDLGQDILMKRVELCISGDYMKSI